MYSLACRFAKYVTDVIRPELLTLYGFVGVLLQRFMDAIYAKLQASGLVILGKWLEVIKPAYDAICTVVISTRGLFSIGLTK